MSRMRTLWLALCLLAAAAAAAEDEPQEGSPSEAKPGAGEGAPASEDAPENAAPAIEEAPVTVPAEVFEEGMKAFRAGDTMRAANKLWHLRWALAAAFIFGVALFTV